MATLQVNNPLRKTSSQRSTGAPGTPTDEVAKENLALEVFFQSKYCRKYCVKYVAPAKLSIGARATACEGCKCLENEHLLFKDKKATEVKTLAKESHSWRPEVHLRSVEHKTVGRLNFSDQVENYEKLADFAIISDDSHPKLVLDLLLKEWKLIKPNLVISVTGSTKSLTITADQYARIKSGLMKAVTSTESWVIAGGTSMGVDGLVGEALKEAQVLGWIGAATSKFHLIGITNWNAIDENVQISKHNLRHPTSPYLYKVKQRKKAAKAGGLKKIMYPLNPVYSHFANIEGGIRGEWGQDIKVRSKTEQFIGRSPQTLRSPTKKDDGHVVYKNDQAIGGLGIPVVLIVLGGDFDTFERCANALNNYVPVLLCEGTGSAADILCASIRLADPDTNELPEEAEVSVMQMMDSGLSIPKEKNSLFSQEGLESSKHMHFVKECIRNKNHITIFRLDRAASTTMSLDECILKALLTSQTAAESGTDPVEVALNWHRCDDFVKEMLIAAGDDINSRPNMGDLMTRAILEDQIPFIELFLDCGMEMFRFLTPKKLMELYEDSVESYPPFLKMLADSTGKYKTKYSLTDVYKIVYRFTSAKPKMKVIKGEQQLDDESAPVEYGFEDPFRELFIWAVLSNRMDESEFFWMHSKQPMMLALIGSSLWNACAQRTSSMDDSEGGDDMKDEMEENHAKYEEYAQGMLDMCWNTNKDLACKILEEEFHSFGNKTLLDVAGFIETKGFIAHPATQVTIENWWKGGLRCRSIQILYSLFLPPYISRLKLNETFQLGYSVDWMDDGANTKPVSLMEPTAEEEELQEELAAKRAETNKFSYKAKLYYQAPVTKFVSHTLAYFVFLMMFTWFYLFENWEGEYRMWDYINMSFMLSYILEEIRQFITQDATFGMKIKLWAQSEWNILDAVYLTLGTSAFIMKALPSEEDGGYFDWFSISKALYGIVLFFMWVRLLRFYQCSPRLGPMWIMIRKMLVQTLVFMTVLTVVLLAFGVSQKALLNIYGYSDVYLDGIKWLVIRPFLMFNGELFLESSLEAENVPTAMTFYTIIQLLFGNALMLNLLIAIYGEIFSTVQETADTDWKHEFTILVGEYQDKTYMPPPLAIFETLYGIITSCCSKDDSAENDDDAKKQLKIFETYCLSKVLSERLAQKSTDSLIAEIDVDIQLQKDKVRDAQSILESIRKGILRKKEKKEEEAKKKFLHKKDDPHKSSLFGDPKGPKKPSDIRKSQLVQDDHEDSDDFEFDESITADHSAKMLFSAGKGPGGLKK